MRPRPDRACRRHAQPRAGRAGAGDAGRDGAPRGARGRSRHRRRRRAHAAGARPAAAPLLREPSSSSSCRRPATTPSRCASCRAIRRCACAARSCACGSPSRRASSRSAGATCRATPSAIGALARESEPVVRQLLVASGPTGDERRVRAQADGHPPPRRARRRRAAACPRRRSHIASFSSSTLTYKGLLTARQLAGLLRRPARARDRDARWRSSTRASRRTRSAPGISRTRSTTWPTTARSTPCAATRQWMHAREPQLRSTLLGDDLPKLFPIDRRALVATPRRSTRPSSCSCSAGRAPAHALAMLIPAAWSRPDADARRRARVLRVPRRHARAVGRPGRDRVLRRRARSARRSTATACARAATRSRATGWSCSRPRPASLDLDPAEVVVNDRLRPGPDADRRHRRRAHPRRRGDQARAGAPPPLPRAARRAEDLPRGHPLAAGRAAGARRARSATCAPSATREEELRGIIAPMARDGAGAGRLDGRRHAAGRALASARGCCAATSSSTSPRSRTRAIDPQREALVMSLRTAVGASGNLLDESPDHARRAGDGAAGAARAASWPSCARCRATASAPSRCDCMYRPARRRPRARARARRAVPRAPRARSRWATAILVLSDRGVGRRRRADPGAAGHRRRAQPPRARGLRARSAAWSSSRASRARSCTSRCCSATAPRPSTRTSRSSSSRAVAPAASSAS